MSRIVVASSNFRGGIGRAVGSLAAERGHEVTVLTRYQDVSAVRAVLTGAAADAVVLVPRRGDAWRESHDALAALVSAAAGLPGPVQIVLLSSFAVGHGMAHPLNRTSASLQPGRVAAERVLRESGLPYTIVRPTWMTDDPPGSHALTFTQDPFTDGMVARADIAAAMVAAIEEPTARGRTFGLYNEPGEPTADWRAAFAALEPDAAAPEDAAARQDAAATETVTHEDLV